MSVNIDIRVKRANKIYLQNEKVSGTVIITAPAPIKHNGVSLTMEGLVNLQLSPKNAGIFEPFYNSIKPVTVCFATGELTGPGTLPKGATELPFGVELITKGNRTMYETYHGVFINIQYTLKCELKRGFMSKDLIKVAEFIVESKPEAEPEYKPVSFVITPHSVESGVDLGTIPGFKITGVIDSNVCCINKPFSGQITILHSEIPIKSIELQLVRVETCGCAEGYAKDGRIHTQSHITNCRDKMLRSLPKEELRISHRASLETAGDIFYPNMTEIQNIQIGEGNVACGIAIPIYMIFPRLFTCPTLSTTNFKVEFQVNVLVVFENDHMVSESFPITLIRTS